jgi:hypothetical protein
VAGDRINADVQDLGIECSELFAQRVQFGHLGGSGRSPVERMKGDHHVLLPPVVA